MRRTAAAQLDVFLPDGGTQTLEYLSCCHCGKLHPTAGAVALLSSGFPCVVYCPKCDGIRCPECEACVPLGQQLDNIEAGRHVLAPRPTQILVPG